MDESLPYVTAALLCESVIEDKSGVLSVIRIIDRAEVELQSTDSAVLKSLTEKGVVPTLQVKSLISIKSGPLSGKFNIHIEGQKPSGKRSHLHTIPVELKGGDSGSNLVISIVIAVDEDGLYWFDVFFENKLLSRMPITIVRGKTEEAKSGEAQTKA
jgi:hypothetical protein